MIREFAHLAVPALALIGVPVVLAATEPEKLGEFKGWEAYTYTSSEGKVCYAMAKPKASEPEGVNRDPVFFLITNRPKQGHRNEVSTIIGYNFKDSSLAQLVIGPKTYDLFTKDDGAWAENKERDREIIGALKKGADMSLKGQSWRGTATTDHYSLEGVSAAVDKIDEACKE